MVATWRWVLPMGKMKSQRFLQDVMTSFPFQRSCVANFKALRSALYVCTCAAVNHPQAGCCCFQLGTNQQITHKLQPPCRCLLLADPRSRQKSVDLCVWLGSHTGVEKNGLKALLRCSVPSVHTGADIASNCPSAAKAKWLAGSVLTDSRTFPEQK